MSWMFSHCTIFNQDIGKWDTNKVSDMSWMFAHCTIFNQDISKWDTNKVSDMSWMFYKAKIFNQDISSWNVSNVTDMRDMFVYDNFERVDILKEYFNGSIPKGKIIDILKDKYPENFI